MAELQKIGRYQIEKALGSGSYADVYKAIDTVLKRTVALKLLKPALLADQEAFARFITEAQVGASLVHPRIAWVWDLGEADGRYFIAMRYVEGASLEKVIAEKGCLGWEQALAITRQVGEALTFAHAAGLVHRDVKPQNILLSPSEGAVLSDFGLVRAMEASGSLTRTGMMLGTPQYMPPEVWKGETAGPAADQYALACVLAQMLTGKCPFDGPTPPAVMMKHFSPVVLPEQWGGGAPDTVTAVLKQAFASQSEDRYRDIQSFISALAPPSQAQSVISTRTGPVISEQESEVEDGEDELQVIWEMAACEIWNATDQDFEGTIQESFRKPEPLRRLKVIDVEGKLTDKGFSCISKLQNLQYLSIDGMKLTSRGWQVLGDLRSLISLELCDTENFDNHALSAFSKTPNLNCIRLENGGPVDKEGGKFLRQLENLSTLSFSNFYLHRQPSDLEWLEDLTTLEDLALRYADLTDESIPYIIKLINLNTLDLSENSAITGTGLRYLTTLRNLKELDLGLCHGIKDGDMDVFARFPNLCSLNLIHNQNITDDGLMKLARSEASRKLKLLFIAGCKKTTLVGRKQVKMMMKNTEVITGDEPGYVEY